MEVFWKNGIEATSVGDLLEATGLSRSSFYDVFGSNVNRRVKRGQIAA